MWSRLLALGSRLRSTLDGRVADDEAAQEIEAHAELLTDRYIRSGMAPDEARLAARRQVGNLTLVREEIYQMNTIGWLDGLLQDLRYAARSLRKNPGFATAAILTLALGVGASTAIFSVVHAVMLRPLPYSGAERLVRVWESNPELGRLTYANSQPNFLDWHARSRAFSALAATSGTTFTVTSGEGAEIVNGERVTAGFLSVLGVFPALGRNFLPDEDRPGGNVRVAILGDGFWQRRFASDRSILGRQIALGGVQYTIVGVLPRSFRWGAETVDVLVPLAPDAAASRGDRQLQVIGRLTEGVTVERAHNELAGIAAALAEQYPESNNGWSVRLTSFYDWLIPETVRGSLVLLLGAIAVLLLIACANVASLLLARAATREKELSIRVALGAARRRIIRQLLTESLLLSLVAGVVGLAGGAAAARLLVAYGPAGVPRLDETSFDLSVFLFALAVSVTTAFVFGMAPAMQVSRQHPAATLQDATRGSSGGVGRQRMRSALTVIEVALSVMLLIGAGLLLRSVWRLQQVDPGFNPSPLMMARVALPGATYPIAARGPFYQRLLAEVQALPGIASAAATSSVPLAGGNFSTEVQVPGAEPDRQGSAGWRLVSPGYFAAMGIPLRGRDFSWGDRENQAPTTIISETMAREYWPNQDPIGQTVTLSTFGNVAFETFGNRARTIIGVAGDVRHVGLDAEPQATVYYSAVEVGVRAPMRIVWRTSLNPASHVTAVRDIVHRLDPTVPLYEAQPLSELLADSFAPRRFNMYLLAAFASVAVLLAAIGLFGVTAYLVAQRTREIGVRLALGADRRDIFRLILGRGIALAATGAVIGVFGAFWLTRVMQSLVFSVSTTDPGTFVAVPTLLVLVALVACYIPARRAMNVDPMVALRGD